MMDQKFYERVVELLVVEDFDQAVAISEPHFVLGHRESALTLVKRINEGKYEDCKKVYDNFGIKSDDFPICDINKDQEGEKKGMNEKRLVQIATSLKDGFSFKDIAAEYNVSTKKISNINSGLVNGKEKKTLKRFKFTEFPINKDKEEKRGRRIKFDIVKVADLLKKETIAAVTRETGLSRATVTRVKTGDHPNCHILTDKGYTFPIEKEKVDNVKIPNTKNIIVKDKESAVKILKDLVDRDLSMAEICERHNIKNGSSLSNMSTGRYQTFVSLISEAGMNIKYPIRGRKVDPEIDKHNLAEIFKYDHKPAEETPVTDKENVEETKSPLNVEEEEVEVSGERKDVIESAIGQDKEDVTSGRAAHAETAIAVTKSGHETLGKPNLLTADEVEEIAENSAMGLIESFVSESYEIDAQGLVNAILTDLCANRIELGAQTIEMYRDFKYSGMTDKDAVDLLAKYDVAISANLSKIEKVLLLNKIKSEIK